MTGKDPLLIQPRNLIIAGEGSRAVIVETHISFSHHTYLANSVTEVAIAKGAAIRHYKVQHEYEGAYHIASTQVSLQEGSRYTSYSFAFGGQLARNSVKVELDGDEAEARLTGLYFATGTQHLDNHTLVRHVKPYTRSHQIYKGMPPAPSSCSMV